MLYREAGQFKTSYAADQQIFPILQDRVGIAVIAAIALGVLPLVATEYLTTTILIPFLVMSIAAIGLNILTGYAGQLSLGTGGFMATGAFAAYKLSTAFPDLNIVFVFLGSGVITAFVGVLFGIPSLRIKGFYLAVATLAAQFFLLWLFNKVPWFTNYSSSGVISAPPRAIFGDIMVTGSSAHYTAKYLFLLVFVGFLALAAKNLTRCHLGRAWMAIRDMDIAAEIIGIKPLQTKLSAFAISSFYCGIAGAAWAFIYTGSVEPLAFSIEISFKVLFMVIIGGLGSILGSFLGAGFMVLLPVILTNAPHILGLNIPVDMISHLEYMIFGALIIFFLIVEPHGLARLWQIGKEKLRLWPFPY
ncbi:branched-chain amino acid ABC transporter permease [Novispirillum itersonii]|uniref:Branched-chain amino acid transport system permease protein n=1 Tax=Novispirillum itersonii TaxID=189 RepID=A0A7X0DN35_NOVIT|nr:branched-chain amino acid ABC transporter permease [Novispirillum itersonii]MBB6209822.1 branched-chain amino acid transport system permease protein [Novispirillum itersonii]